MPLSSIFSYIMATSFSGGRSRSTRREPTDHGQATGKLYHMRLRVECTCFCNLQRRAGTHAVLVIGLYELLDNPTTQLIEPPRPWKTWGCQLTFIERCGSQTDLSFIWCLQVSVVPLTVQWFLEDFPLSFIFNTAGFVHSACTSVSVVSGSTRLDSMYSCPGRYSPLQSLLMFGAEFVPRLVVLSPVCTTL
jgi:hypothetical protein